MAEEKNNICESLKIMEDIAINAEKSIKEKSSNNQSSANSLTTVHTLNDDSSVKNLDQIKNKNLDNLYKLKIEPIISRVIVLNENEEEQVYYISRVMPISTNNKEVIFSSYYAPIGRLASIPAGEDIELNIGGENKYFEILERVIYHVKNDGEWDSINTIIEKEDVDRKTIESLRKYCNLNLQTDEDILAILLKEEELSKLVHEGIKKEIIRGVGLRDQPILDRFQDDIFRLPLNDKLLILGSPGTGKTTTLIKRLGQKLDEMALNTEELELIKDFPTNLPHQNSWLMFTPTELLKHYVREAFNKEGIPAPDNNIKTWSDYRLYLTRGVLDILKSETGSSTFILNDEKATLKNNALIQTIDLYESFSLFFKQQLKMELKISNEWLLENIEDSNLLESNQYINDILNDTEVLTINNLRSIDRLGKQFSEVVKTYQTDISKVIEGSLNIILNKDRDFLKKLKTFMETLNISIEELDIDDEENSDRLSKSELTRGYSLAIRVYARARYNEKNLNPKSKNAKIIEWLDDRIIDEDKIINLGRKINTLTHFRKFLNPLKLYVNKIPSQYKKFRAIKENIHWYNLDKKSQNILHSLEVDIILLLTLKNLNALRGTLSINAGESNSYLSSFQPLFNEYRNQILVDEATDFSPIQLACMLELTNQKIQSFFACGDFNQRITTFGTQTEEEMKWVSNRFDIREIDNPYRQSKILTNLAKLIVNENIEELVETKEIAPILIENMTDIETLSLWLKNRISEIEKMVEFLPSIAIFVNSREEVDELTEALNKVMINIPVKGYRDGQGIGHDGDIRIFDIQHIKGLEFEAVFFVNVDKLAEEKPLLFDKYLYVGVTRATTYLGITCEKALPSQIEHTRDMFIDEWLN
ncbi:MAG TPA: DNA helicase UvrD [Arcobacter sp.]|nr:DNA helicase UvrD [Arcobacter sp.]